MRSRRFDSGVWIPHGSHALLKDGQRQRLAAYSPVEARQRANRVLTELARDCEGTLTPSARLSEAAWPTRRQAVSERDDRRAMIRPVLPRRFNNSRSADVS